MMKASLRARLQSDRWLSKLTPKARDLVIGHLRVRDFHDGETVYRTGDEPDGLYGIIEGEVRHAIFFETGQVLLNHVAKPGEWFGECGVLDGKPRINEAYCTGPTRLVHLSFAEADALMRQSSAFARAVALLLCRHYRGSMAFAARTLMQPISAQIAYALLSLVRRRIHLDGMTMSIRQEDIANIVGVSRQTVAPVLRKLQERGVIQLGYSSITVTDLAALDIEARRFDPAGA